jgi:glycosyltransferase involved in cell wall biosynthesis
MLKPESAAPGNSSSPTTGRRRRLVYLDHCAQASGGELALARLAPALASFEPTVILAEEGPLVKRLIDQGIPTRVLSMQESSRALSRRAVRLGIPTLLATWGTLRYVLALTRLLRAERPDLIATNSLKSALYGGLAGLLTGSPVVWHLHDRVAPDYLPPQAVALVRLSARLMPAAIIANSRTTLATLGLDHGPKRARVMVAIGCATPLAGGGRRARGSGTADLLIGIVGRIQPWKGQDVFLRAFAAAFPDGGASAALIGGALFGEDEFLRQLENLVASLGLSERVTFTGHLADPVPNMERLDILVHASVIPEPFGQVVVEGVALGLPVVAAGAGGPAEVITDGVDGLLYPPGDVPALASVLRKLANDAGLRRRLGAEALSTAAQYAPDVIAAQVEAVYATALTGVRD